MGRCRRTGPGRRPPDPGRRPPPVLDVAVRPGPAAAAAVQRHRRQPGGARPVRRRPRPGAEVIRFDPPGVGGSPRAAAALPVPAAGPAGRPAAGRGWGTEAVRRARALLGRRPGPAVRVPEPAPLPPAGAGRPPATGWTMLPAHPRVLPRMLTPRRHRDPGYARAIAGDIYGGSAARTPRAGGQELITEHDRPAPGRGYLYQLAAGAGLDQPAVPAADPAADADRRRRRRPDHPGGQRADHGPAAPGRPAARLPRRAPRAGHPGRRAGPAGRRLPRRARRRLAPPGHPDQHGHPGGATASRSCRGAPTAAGRQGIRPRRARPRSRRSRAPARGRSAGRRPASRRPAAPAHGTRANCIRALDRAAVPRARVAGRSRAIDSAPSQDISSVAAGPRRDERERSTCRSGRAARTGRRAPRRQQRMRPAAHDVAGAPPPARSSPRGRRGSPAAASTPCPACAPPGEALRRGGRRPGPPPSGRSPRRRPTRPARRRCRWSARCAEDDSRPTRARPTVSSVSRAADGTGTRPLPQLSPTPTTSTRPTSARTTLLRSVNSSGAAHAHSAVRR